MKRPVIELAVADAGALLVPDPDEMVAPYVNGQQAGVGQVIPDVDGVEDLGGPFDADVGEPAPDGASEVADGEHAVPGGQHLDLLDLLQANSDIDDEVEAHDTQEWALAVVAEGWVVRTRIICLVRLPVSSGCRHVVDKAGQLAEQPGAVAGGHRGDTPNRGGRCYGSKQGEAQGGGHTDGTSG
jgi:hypothetical protein